MGKLRTDTYTALYSLSSAILLEPFQVLGRGKGVTGKEMKAQSSSVQLMSTQLGLRQGWRREAGPLPTTMLRKLPDTW